MHYCEKRDCVPFQKGKEEEEEEEGKKKLESSWGEKPGDLASMWCFFDIPAFPVFLNDSHVYFFVMY